MADPSGSRRSGLLLHPTSLPGPHGIGDLGPEARAFVDFLKDAGQSVWQVLPLGPTGYGDSPYQSFSAFAGNPLLLSLDALVDEGLLRRKDLQAVAPRCGDGDIDFAAVQAYKQPLLRQAFTAFERDAAAGPRGEFAAFRRAHESWLDDFTLFMAQKEAHGGASWTAWDEGVVVREPGALEAQRAAHADEIAFHGFVQYTFFRQWLALREHAASCGVAFMGDVPIFAAHDSADVWSHPDLFFLAADGSPAFVAGVPPDYFSATGQRWGNPLYRWDAMARTGFAWWIERFRVALMLVDSVRLDHFRGFEAYWEVPGEEPTAMVGRWVKGPGAALLEALRERLGSLPIVAENLGVITPEVEALREAFALPGMAILQFAFGSDSSAENFKPHNHTRDLVVYTGTHDNDTLMGWWSGGVGDSTRSAEMVAKEKDRCLRYLGSDGRAIHWDFIRAAMASVADTAVIPVQDVLGLGNEARMNLPSRASGNWRWRLGKRQLTPRIAARLRDYAQLYGRFRGKEASA
jgi:4-alpha-glucanotransferase